MTPQELLQGGPQAALQGGAPPQGAPQDVPQGQGMNPGGIEALRNGVKFLMQAGMSPEEILDALLKLAQEKGLDIPEDQLRQIIENETGQGTPGQTPGQTPQGAPPAGTPPTLQ